MESPADVTMTGTASTRTKRIVRPAYLPLGRTRYETKASVICRIRKISFHKKVSHINESSPEVLSALAA